MFSSSFPSQLSHFLVKKTSNVHAETDVQSVKNSVIFDLVMHKTQPNFTATVQQSENIISMLVSR